MTDSPKTEYKYWAFISYSHRDKAWGDWLHRSLETYKVPKKLVGQKTTRGEAVPRRVYPVFRDREELPTASDLGANLRNAIEQSRYLVVICSPKSAKSHWVNEEILSFKRLGRENRILALIVEGEPYASDGKPGFEADQECFPEALRYKLGADGELSDEPTEPIAGDARPHADGKSAALLKLLAGVVGVNYDALKQRELMRRRRRRQLMAAFAVTVAAIGLFVYSRFAAQQRDKLYQEAVAELGVARDALSNGDAALAAVSALNAIETAEDAGRELEPAWWVMRRALDTNRLEHSWQAAGDSIQECGFDSTGRRLLTFDSVSGVAKIWSAPEGKLLASCEAGEYASLAGWIPGTEEIVTVRTWEEPAESWDEPGTQIVDLIWWDSNSGESLRTVRLENCYYIGVRFNTDGIPEWIQVTDTSESESRYRLVRLSDGWSEQFIPQSQGGAFEEIEFVPDCGVVLQVNSASGVSMYSLGGDARLLGKLEGIDSIEKLRLRSIVPSVDGKVFAAVVWSDRDAIEAGAWSVADGSRLARVELEAGGVLSSAWLRAVGPDALASASSELLDQLAGSLGRKGVRVSAYNPHGFAWHGEVGESDAVAVALSSYGDVSVSQPQIDWEYALDLSGADAESIALSPRGDLVAVGDDRGSVSLWRTESPFEVEAIGDGDYLREPSVNQFGTSYGNLSYLRTGAAELQIWDLEKREASAIVSGFVEPSDLWLEFLVNQDAGWLVAAPSLPVMGPPVPDQVASFHDLDTGSKIGEWPAANYTLSATGRRALGSREGVWRIVSANDDGLEEVALDSSRSVVSEWSSVAQFLGDGYAVIVANSDGVIEVFDSETGQLNREVPFAEDLDTSINHLAVSPSGAWALLATWEKWWLVNLDTGKSIEAFSDEDQPDGFSRESFLAGETLLAGTARGKTKWWSFPELEPVAEVSGEYSVSETTLDSEALLLRDVWDDEAVLADRKTGGILARFANAIATDLDGRHVVIEDSEYGDAGIRVLRTEDGETLLHIENLNTNTAAVADDGSRVAFFDETNGRLLSVEIPYDSEDLRSKASLLRDRLK